MISLVNTLTRMSSHYGESFNERSLINSLPKELILILRDYCYDFRIVLFETGLFPLSKFGQKCSKNSITYFAAKGGYLSLLKWARSKKYRWNEDICTISAYQGHLEILQWARGNGCPWNALTCNMAAWNGQLDV